jgi:predicted translin family RNA/ssDNA-binding protein
MNKLESEEHKTHSFLHILGSMNRELKNYDKSKEEFESISSKITEKRLAVENLLKQKDFASLKQKLEQYKQQKGIQWEFGMQ